MVIQVRAFLFASFLTSILITCSNSSGEKKEITSLSREINDITIPGGFSAQTQLYFDSAALQRFLEQYPVFKAFQSDLEKFYSQRNYAYAWYDEKGMIEQAGNLYNRIINISEEGLPGKLPYLNTFRQMMDSLQGMDESSKPDTQKELMLTAQYFVYARVAWQGMTEKESRSLEWFLPRKKVNLPQLMDSLLSEGDSLFVYEPVYRQYGLLKQQLKKYRDIEAMGEWAEIKTERKTYKPRDSSTVVEAIRKRLYLLGDINSDNHSLVYDEELINGIKSFQQRVGIKQDGIMGPAFFKEINYPIGKRIEQIIVNMERSRWLPQEPVGYYLAVNIPAFSLLAYHGDSLLWTMKVVVGKAIHETAVFYGELKYVVFSPYWNVPPGIMKNEVLPAIRRNPNYLERQNMEWNGNSVRQKPGPNNALGLVKFLFPNSYNIYLHDSPAKSLFELDKRAFSHGCIRVSRAWDLTKWLLRDYPEWTDEKLEAAMHAGKERFFTLKETVPVFITYFTSWVDRKGKINFREDVYKRDSRLAKMIMENPRI